MAKRPKLPTAVGNPISAPSKKQPIDTSSEFTLVTQFNGYRNKEDITNLPPGYLVKGSQDVLTNSSERVAIRRGYTLDGQADTTDAPILSAFDWERHSGNIVNLRAGNSKLQFRYKATGTDYYNGVPLTMNQVLWIDLLTGTTSDYFNFTDFWDLSDAQALLLFVNGQSQIDSWTGGVTTIESVNYDAGAIYLYEHVPYSGGSGYTIGDQLLLTTGNANAYFTVDSTVDYAILSADLAGGNGGSGYTINDVLDLGVGGGSVIVTAIAGGGPTGPVDSVAVFTAGQGYNTGIYAADGGTGNGALIHISSVSGIGSVASVILNGFPGSGYISQSNQATSGGTGGGCTITVDGVGNGYLEKQGTTTWAEEGFSTSGVHTIRVKGNDYTVQGGWGSTYLVGLSADPTGQGIVGGELAIQESEVTLNTDTVGNRGHNGLPASNVPPYTELWTNDLIAVLNNQVYIGSFLSRNVFISKTNSYIEWGFSQPTRLIGEGAIITLDGDPVAFQPQENAMYISAAHDQWYETQFTLGSLTSSSSGYPTNSQTESLTIQRLKTSAKQGAQSQAFVSKDRNDVLMVNFEPSFTTLGRVEGVIETPQTTNISDPIINDFYNYDFTDGCCFYFQYYYYIAIPKENTVRVFNLATNYWEAPLNLHISRFAIIDGELYGHSYESPQTFKLFTGHDDNGHPIKANATFSFQNFGQRAKTKYFNEFYVEGYISQNTKLNVGIQYDLDGCATVTNKTILGTDSQIVCINEDTVSLGKSSLGKNPLGGTLFSSNANTLPPKFRVIETFPRVNFYEYQPSFSSYGTDYDWEILAFGPMVTQSVYAETNIKE